MGRRIRPSPAGEAALGALTRVFDEAASLGTLLAELAGARVTTLRIAASDYLGEALLVPVIRQLVEAKVPLHFEITTTHSTAATRLVADSQVDLAIVSAEREPGAGRAHAVPPAVRLGGPAPARGRPRAWWGGWRASRCCACCRAAAAGGCWTSTSDARGSARRPPSTCPACR